MSSAADVVRELVLTAGAQERDLLLVLLEDADLDAAAARLHISRPAVDERLRRIRRRATGIVGRRAKVKP